MASEKIRFGTSGWRGVIADDFTFSRVRIVIQAIADHLAALGLKDKGVVVGYDTRFLSERFAAEARAGGRGGDALLLPAAGGR